MSEKSEKSERAFQYLVRVLEEAVRARADSVGLEREDGDLMVVQYSKSSGLAQGPVPKELEQALVDEIINRAGLAHSPRGEIQIHLAGRDYRVIVDERDESGESAFNLLLKKSTGRRKYKESSDSEKQEALPESPVGTRHQDNESGTEFEAEPALPSQQKTGRNEPCPCGSGKKYKKCCLRKQNNGSLFD